MNQDLHTAISEAVADRLGWSDPGAIGRGAALPDQLEIATVNGSGTRILGRNISCCTHFAGYNLGMDRSLGNLELPDRDVEYIPGVWPEIPMGMESGEPLYQLLKIAGYNHAFDELTWPCAWSYAQWLEACFFRAAESHRDVTPRDRAKRLGTIAGMCLHFAQDLCVPQHRRNELLARHVTIEDEASRRWEKMSEIERVEILYHEMNAAAPWNARGVAQGLCARPTPKVPCFAWRRRKLVDRIIRDGIRVTAGILKGLGGVQ